jgi:hypothetical protein
MTPRVIALAVFCAVGMTAGAAAATPNFPATLQSYLQLPYIPPCALCHENGVTGIGTVHTPFGESMVAAGLKANDVTSLGDALTMLSDDKTDSDGDGVSDVDELEQNMDPNTVGGGSLSDGTPLYGCGAEIAGGGSRDGAFAAAGVALALGALARRRRSRGKR